MRSDLLETMSTALQRLADVGMKPERWHVGEELRCDLDGGISYLPIPITCAEALGQRVFLGVPLVAIGKVGADWVLDTDAGFSVFGPALALSMLEFGETVSHHAQMTTMLH